MAHMLVMCVVALADMVQAHEKEGYRWWAQRLGRCFQLYDETRIAHFRGFAGNPFCIQSVVEQSVPSAS